MTRVSEGGRRPGTGRGVRATAGALALFLGGLGGAGAQSLFDQMPATPGETGAAPAAAAPSASMSTLPTNTMPMGVPAARSMEQTGVDCNGIQKTLIERKALVAKANAASNAKQKMTPQQACALFNQLQANGTSGVKWITQNKEWCSIPDSFSEGFKADNARVGGIRDKICKVAAQASQMEAQAQAGGGGGGGGGGLLGGPGLTGSFKMPQGAL